jgi:hypothetical protein
MFGDTEVGRDKGEYAFGGDRAARGKDRWGEHIKKRAVFSG